VAAEELAVDLKVLAVLAVAEQVILVVLVLMQQLTLAAEAAVVNLTNKMVGMVDQVL